jgi:chromosome segregation ATPase
MDRLLPLILLIFALGGFYLGLAGLFRLGSARPEIWFFGLGVRSRLGACKVLVVAASLLLLAIALNKKITLGRLLAPETESLQTANENLMKQLSAMQGELMDVRKQLQITVDEKNALDGLISRQGNGLAQKSDVVGELKTALLLRQRELSESQLALDKVRLDFNRLQSEQQQLNQNYIQTQEQLRQLESKYDVLNNEKISLGIKLEQATGQHEADLQKIQTDVSRLKGMLKDMERRTNLLRQGLSLREASDWTLEQEIQRLSGLISRQFDLNAPEHSEIASSFQRVTQALNEGTSLTKQAKIAEAKGGANSK